MKTGVFPRLSLALLLVVVAGLPFGCGDDPPPTRPPIPPTESLVLTAERHSFPLLHALPVSPDVMYAGGYFTGIAEITPGRTVLEDLGGGFTVFARLWASSPSDVFAVGADMLGGHGAIYHHDGSAWSEMSHSLQSSVQDIEGTSWNNVYVATNDGKVAHYDGTSWTVVYEHSSNLNGVWTDASGHVFAVGEFGAIVHYDGATWYDETLTEPAPFLRVWGSGPSDVYAVAEDSVYHYDGNDWNVAFDHNEILYDVDGVASDSVIVVGENGSILHYNGLFWIPVVVPGVGDDVFFAVTMTSATSAVAVGANGMIARFDGIGWHLEHKAADLTWQDVWGMSANNVFAVAAEGTLATYDGSHWDYTGATGNLSPTAAWAATPDRVWVVGTEGGSSAVYEYDGASWTHRHTPPAAPRAIWGSSNRDIFVVCDIGMVSHLDSTSWSDTTLTGSDLHDVYGPPGADVFVVGEGGSIFRHDGADWTDVNLTLGLTRDVYAVWGTGPGDVLVVGEEGLLLRYDGRLWRSEVGGFPVDFVGVWASARDDYWAITRGSIIFHYDGTRWDFSSFGFGFSLSSIWGSGPGRMFMCGENDMLLHYAPR